MTLSNTLIKVINLKKEFELKFGCIDIQNINDYLEDKSVDFIMTDPLMAD